MLRRIFRRKKLGKKEFGQYRELLIQLRQKFSDAMSALSKEAFNKSQRDASGDLSGYSYHMADAATDSYDRDFSFNRATQEQDIIYEIDEALKRIDDKTYGVCQQCEKPIKRSRLKALPYARFCIKCQSEEETRKIQQKE